MPIVVNLDVMMAKRKMSLSELAQKVDLTLANLSILKNNHAKAVRFTTLEAICRALDCQPGDILEYVPSPPPPAEEAAASPYGPEGKTPPEPGSHPLRRRFLLVWKKIRAGIPPGPRSRPPGAWQSGDAAPGRFPRWRCPPPCRLRPPPGRYLRPLPRARRPDWRRR